jgi:hypothetical protein
MAVTSLRRRIHFKTIFDICDDDHLSRNLLAILLERLVRFQALTKHSRRMIITKRQHFLTPLSLLHIKFSLASSCIVFIPLDFTWEIRNFWHDVENFDSFSENVRHYCRPPMWHFPVSDAPGHISPRKIFSFCSMYLIDWGNKNSSRVQCRRSS